MQGDKYFPFCEPVKIKAALFPDFFSKVLFSF